jgi:hypothetical protein
MTSSDEENLDEERREPEASVEDDMREREEEVRASAGRGGRVLSRLARRLQNPRELGGDAMDLMGSILESSDRVKTEAVRMVAREVRHYLEELKLKDGVRDLITGHSLEMQISLSLKPLEAALGDEEGEEEAGEDEELPQE